MSSEHSTRSSCLPVKTDCLSQNRKSPSSAGEPSDEKLSVQEIGIAEVLLMPDSKLINKAVKDSGFRDKYGVNILGIQRKNEYIQSDIKEVKMHSGDILLIQGTWDSIARMSHKQSQWVVLGQPVEEASKVTLDYKAPVAALIMTGMIAAMVFDFIPIPPVAAVLIAAILMVLTGCFRNVEDAYKTINWESIVLIAAMLPMSLALEKTGASNLISEKLVSGLGDYATCPYGGNLFHDFSAHHVHQQYGNSGTGGSHRVTIGLGNRGQSLPVPAGRNGRCEHVLRLSLLDSSERSGHVGGQVHIHELCQSRHALANHHGNRHDLHIAIIISVLNIH